MPGSHAIDDPPPEVLDEVLAAWERAREPLGGLLELDFASEPAWGGPGASCGRPTARS